MPGRSKTQRASRAKQIAENREAYFSHQDKRYEELREKREKKAEALEAKKQTLEERLDAAEKALDILCTVDRNPSALIFFLKTQGRKRGYIEHAPEDTFDATKLESLKQFFASVGSAPPISASTAQSQDTGPSASAQSKSDHRPTSLSNQFEPHVDQPTNPQVPIHVEPFLPGPRDHRTVSQDVEMKLKERLQSSKNASQQHAQTPPSKFDEQANPGSYKAKSARQGSNFP